MPDKLMKAVVIPRQIRICLSTSLIRRRSPKKLSYVVGRFGVLFMLHEIIEFSKLSNIA